MEMKDADEMKNAGKKIADRSGTLEILKATASIVVDLHYFILTLLWVKSGWKVRSFHCKQTLANTFALRSTSSKDCGFEHLCIVVAKFSSKHPRILYFLD